MNRHAAAMMAGFVATVVLSAIMIMKSIMGLMPDVNAIAMLTAMANNMLGTPPTPLVGWLIHLLIGTVLWGLLFGALYGRLPGDKPWVKGIVFSIGAWLIMMIVLMPMAGAGLFGLGIGIHAPIATLVLHLIYGAVLGAVFGQRLGATADEPALAHRSHAGRIS